MTTRGVHKRGVSMITSRMVGTMFLLGLLYVVFVAVLIAILADPTHPEHESMLEWLGLANSSEFDPTRFDIDDANSRLNIVSLAGHTR